MVSKNSLPCGHLTPLKHLFHLIIKYIPLQQGLRLCDTSDSLVANVIIKYIPLQQGMGAGTR